MRRLLLLVTFAAFATSSIPTRAQFCPGAAPWVFDDVPAGDLFCGYITWAAQNGITLGCAVIDANHRLFCPNDAVKRSEMAAFVNRLGNVRVEAVGTGPGLTGGPITSTGTINLAATNLLPTTPCTSNQIARWNGSAWACSTDANSGGTVTSVGSGTGLAGGPITASGSLSIATGYQLPQGCTNGQVAKSSGSNAWTCANDVNSGGTVTSIAAGAGLTGGTITTTGTIAVDPASTALTGNFFRQNGNAFGATAVLGTTDGNAIDIRVNGSRVMRYEPNAISPNVIGGSPANNVTAGVRGATIAGGGVLSGDTDPVLIGEAPNRVTDAYGTVGGGYANVAGDDAGSTIDHPFATVAGGTLNVASGPYGTIGGGEQNAASDRFSTVAGGTYNKARGYSSTVAGGYGNDATGLYSTVAGGYGNDATGLYSTVGGGDGNTASGNGSFAAGTSANADANGCFVWNDRSGGAISCGGPGTGDNRVVMRATGGFIFLTHANNAVGAQLLPGANAWSIYSDRDYKDHVREVDAGLILDRLVALPIATWNWKSQDVSVRHMGPTAQDFHAAFGLGETRTMINTVDVSGVALAAIQGLNEKLEARNAQLEAKIAERDAKIDAQARAIADLRRTVEVLLARTSAEGRIASK